MKDTLSKFAVLTAAAVLFSCCTAQDPIEKRVKEIVHGLSLEEKIGQMVQINISVVTDADGTSLSEHGVEVLEKYKVGSILNVLGDEGACSAEKYREIIRQIQDVSLRATGIPCIYGLDQIHGATYTAGATFFPQEINLAASFNDRYAREMGRILAYETRACNVPWCFSPVMDLGRNQSWPRLWESFGEDTYVNLRMGLEETLGQQGEEGEGPIDEYHTGVSLKHYMAYGATISGQDRTPSCVSMRELREKYFPPFKACCEAGALSVMVNSAMNDGIPFHANRELLTGWLKEELGWKGFIVTDWADVKNLYERDHVATSAKDAARLAVNAGIDMIMDPYSTDICGDLVALVKEGAIPMSRIDDAVRRIIRAKLRLGLFEDPYGQKGSYEGFASAQSEAIAYEAAVESEVLLKNEGGLLPLDASARLLVVGPNANSMRTISGGWSYSWQGDRADDPKFTESYNTILEALRQKFNNVDYEPVLAYHPGREDWWVEDKVSDLGRAVAKARWCDVIVACIGENSYCETPGNIVDLNLSAAQKDMVRALAATGKPVVLVLNEGRPRLIPDIEPLSDAIVDIMLPSNYGGDALAALLCGEENFSGRLPFTYPKYPNRLATYDYLLCENRATMDGMYNYDAKMDVQWPFGYGLSYTGFEYSNMRVDKDSFKAGDTLTVSVDVTNTGTRRGKEAVLLFSSDLYASVTPEVRRLRRYEKIELEAGQRRTVTMTLPAEELSFTGHDLKRHLEKGEFRLSAGSESIIVNCTRDAILP